uniref:Uncharacterized protein n=1 Tax=Rhizophora mucronata TaxID=61149 RepID=A0A2P2NJC9_RHIMU
MMRSSNQVSPRTHPETFLINYKLDTVFYLLKLWQLNAILVLVNLLTSTLTCFSRLVQLRMLTSNPLNRLIEKKAIY